MSQNMRPITSSTAFCPHISCLEGYFWLKSVLIRVYLWLMSLAFQIVETILQSRSLYRLNG